MIEDFAIVDIDWDFPIQENTLLKENRPNCPDCNASFPYSMGSRWECRVCGKKWKKQYAPKIDFTQRPPCPHCGAYHGTIHDAVRYKCGECGRIYHK